MRTAQDKIVWKNGKPYAPCGQITWYCTQCDGWHDPRSCYYDEEAVRHRDDWRMLNANAELLDNEYGKILP